VWAYLERDLAQPALAPIRAWFDANIPADKRGSATIA
jgi:aminoglycoside/choline kinase family phosphotransferase